MRSSLLVLVALALSACQAPIARDLEVRLDVGAERVAVEGVFREGCQGTWTGEAKALCRLLVTPR
ncbi:MAG TPA: hypothetical protein VGD87_10370 [Archangium sp.]